MPSNRWVRLGITVAQFLLAAAIGAAIVLLVFGIGGFRAE